MCSIEIMFSQEFHIVGPLSVGFNRVAVASKTSGAVKEWVGLSKERRMEQDIPEENTGSMSIARKMGGSFMAIGKFKQRIWRII